MLPAGITTTVKDIFEPVSESERIIDSTKVKNEYVINIC